MVAFIGCKKAETVNKNIILCMRETALPVAHELKQESLGNVVVNETPQLRVFQQRSNPTYTRSDFHHRLNYTMILQLVVESKLR